MTDKVNLCRHWKQGLITHLNPVCPFCEIDRLKGEHSMMLNLLAEAKKVIETIDGESVEECESLMDLNKKMHYAIKGAIKGLV